MYLVFGIEELSLIESSLRNVMFLMMDVRSLLCRANITIGDLCTKGKATCNFGVVIRCVILSRRLPRESLFRSWK